MMIRRLSLLLLAALVLSGVAWAADPCRFVVMADNWGRPGVTDPVTPPPAYARAIAEANLLQPEFVVFVGDMVRGYCDVEALEESWEAFEALTKRLEMPIHLVVGNHDVFSKESEQIFQRRYGPLWYSFEVKDCHFIVLDSEDQTAPGRIAGAQWEWLQADLAAAKGKRSFVFIHNPIWGADFAKSEWGKRVHPRLVEAGVDTVFAGHVHQYEREPTRDGVRYLSGCGLAAETKESPLAGGFFHYLFVTARGEGPARVAVVRTGAVEPEDIVTSEQVAQVEEFERQFRIIPLVVEEKAVTRAISWTVSNPFPATVKGTVRFSEGEGWSPQPTCLSFALSPGETCRLEVALTVSPAVAKGPLSCTVEYALADRGTGRVESQIRLIRRSGAGS